LETAVVFAGIVEFQQSSQISSPYSETQPQPGPSLRTTNQLTLFFIHKYQEVQTLRKPAGFIGT